MLSIIMKNMIIIPAREGRGCYNLHMAKGKSKKKEHLPTKICPVCNRPFAWRKKWARDWDRVVYCSDRCRRAGAGGGPTNTGG